MFLKGQEKHINLFNMSLLPLTQDIPLAAQCEIPPHIAQYPFEIVSQRGVSHPSALFS